ncbi:hypothetical protein [Massilia sp. erpn]|uniref:hypothetical protein n=1 Tax=Massilia sp. erpn TaxID=2738142 RepID=UPI00210734CF|nr:hypothetical protein [Massilia sp. erpn]UTY59735.1 hypothetical protein HPQ68_22685 [Massilia sp. erpn]
MKTKGLILFLPLLIALPSLASAKRACEIADAEIVINNMFIPAESVAAVKKCSSNHPICILNDDQKVIAAQDAKEIAKKPSGAVLGAYQPDEHTCLVGQFSGGSAAAWLFEGWDTSSGVAKPINSFGKTRLNSDSVFPAGLVNVMHSAYVKTRKPSVRR